MKTFKDLSFEKEEIFGKEKKFARLFFNNGHGVSVISGYGAYGNNQNPYELAVLYGDENGWDLHYDNNVSKGDVVGWLNEDEVTKLMIEIQKF